MIELTGTSGCWSSPEAGLGAGSEASVCKPVRAKEDYCLEEWRAEQRILPPGDNCTPRGQNSPLGDNFDPGSKFSPRGQVRNGPQLSPQISTQN
jgi:hypothetical protein